MRKLPILLMLSAFLFAVSISTGRANAPPAKTEQVTIVEKVNDQLLSATAVLLSVTECTVNAATEGICESVAVVATPNGSEVISPHGYCKTQVTNHTYLNKISGKNTPSYKSPYRL